MAEEPVTDEREAPEGVEAAAPPVRQVPDRARPAAASIEDGADGKNRLILGLLAVVLAASIVVGVLFGSVRFPYGETIWILLYGIPGVGELLPARGAELDPIHQRIVYSVRLPRVVLAGLVGAGLAVAGTVMQGIFRNPLADPGIIGVSAGGALGAVIAIYTGLFALHAFLLPAMAFAGSLLTLVIVYSLATVRGQTPVDTLLLAGVAVSAFLGACISLILTMVDEWVLREMIFWLLGSFEGRRWQHVWLAGLPILIGCLLIYVFHRDLNALLVDGDGARTLGVPVRWVRPLLLALGALVTGVGVAVSGTIGFVGLVVPHMLRLIVGPNHRWLLPASVLGGAAFLILSDLAARTLLAPAELRVGVVTAFLGVPFFLFLLRRDRKELGW